MKPLLAISLALIASGCDKPRSEGPKAYTVVGGVLRPVPMVTTWYNQPDGGLREVIATEKCMADRLQGCVYYLRMISAAAWQDEGKGPRSIECWYTKTLSEQGRVHKIGQARQKCPVGPAPALVEPKWSWKTDSKLTVTICCNGKKIRAPLGSKCPA